MGSRAHRVSLGDPWSRRVHPDIESERRWQAFDVERLTNLLDYGAQNTALRREIESLVRDDPTFNLVHNYFMTQDEHFLAATQRRLLIHKLAKRLDWTDNSLEFSYVSRALSGDLTLGVHNVAMNAIKSLGSEEQIAKWIPLCETYQIIVSYVQTEMGHGTYLQGLETEATYDTATQEFVIHSPTMTATKWWPGDLGQAATHALIMAQLTCSGTRRGMHAFMVPIRSLQDHSPLPGITVGDIGPKMGMEITDNGFLRLDHVRVPRENMLNRFAQVLPDGTYIRVGIAQVNYLPMVVTRVHMLKNIVLNSLEKACVIATRYSVIRRQSRLRPSEPEAKILDYQTQQQKLIFPLAMSYAFHFQVASVMDLFQQSYDAIRNKDISLLPELHALTTGSKAMMTDFGAHGIELCRRACGGHGYSKLSGLPSLATQVLASCTYEGENTVLYLQVARLLEDSVHHLQMLVQSGADQHEAWNQTSILLLQAAKAHCYYITVKNFKEALEKLEHEPAIHRVLKRLCDFFALHGILADSGSFLCDGFLSASQVDMVRTAYLDLLLQIRKDAILLTDAFDFTDQCLNSALGCYDGNVYERLFHWAQMSPNNNSQEKPAYTKYLRPLLASWDSKL